MMGRRGCRLCTWLRFRVTPNAVSPRPTSSLYVFLRVLLFFVGSALSVPKINKSKCREKWLCSEICKKSPVGRFYGTARKNVFRTRTTVLNAIVSNKHARTHIRQYKVVRPIKSFLFAMHYRYINYQHVPRV